MATQVGSNWTGWQERTPLHLHPDFLHMQMQERFARGDDCASGISRESSRDCINSECKQQFEYEQRFRVDRRKLEFMMINSPETGPSRLKVGAKSKKDPHIRVGGCKEGVRRAKTTIMEVLDTTTNSRVTMKMDVSSRTVHTSLARGETQSDERWRRQTVTSTSQIAIGAITMKRATRY